MDCLCVAVRACMKVYVCVYSFNKCVICDIMVVFVCVRWPSIYLSLMCTSMHVHVCVHLYGIEHIHMCMSMCLYMCMHILSVCMHTHTGVGLSL